MSAAINTSSEVYVVEVSILQLVVNLLILQCVILSSAACIVDTVSRTGIL